MRASVDERPDFTAEPDEHPWFSEQHDRVRLIRDFVGMGYAVPTAA